MHKIFHILTFRTIRLSQDQLNFFLTLYFHYRQKKEKDLQMTPVCYLDSDHNHSSKRKFFRSFDLQ